VAFLPRLAWNFARLAFWVSATRFRPAADSRHFFVDARALPPITLPTALATIDSLLRNTWRVLLGSDQSAHLDGFVPSNWLVNITAMRFLDCPFITCHSAGDEGSKSSGNRK
jgi:hypothetical protein